MPLIPSRCKTGVYCIRNLVNGKVYVGSAGRSFRQRKKEHFGSLRKGKHWNQHLQNAWNKYGETAFRLDVLARCEPGRCVELEQRYIDKMNATDGNRGYNLSPTAGSVLGLARTEEDKEKKSIARKRALVEIPGLAESVRETLQERNRTDESRQRSSNVMKAIWDRPGHREKMKIVVSLAAKRSAARGMTAKQREARSRNVLVAHAAQVEQRNQRIANGESRYASKEHQQRIERRNAENAKRFWEEQGDSFRGRITKAKMAYGRYGGGRTFEEYLSEKYPDLVEQWLQACSHEG